ncbi:YwdI family protein [Lentibacillus sediminis]|uniref:YwdI family protein n=1 Tax=Lentibacillus sediminis TaxID=1940529 RepID=UPI000C1BAEA4|nr:YwdI family protein [Lentibacillus sediminis]
MAVANETIIQKMMDELQQAKEKQGDSGNMTKHIEHVRLLCDLLLKETEEEKVSVPASSQEITQEEMKAMLGKQAEQVKPATSKRTVIDHDGANGESLFDF